MFKKTLPLILIILIAIFLRTYHLNSVPPALFGDEVDVGYQAYSILKTGKDMTGRFMPTYIRSIAEYRAPLFIYSAVPFIGVFGLNEWGVRLPAAFWGALSVIGVYLFASHMFGKRVGLISALLLSISPWHLQYSRAAFEVTLLLCLLIYGCYFFITFTKRRVNLLIAVFLFGLTPYTYSTASVFTPLLMFCLGIAYLPSLKKNTSTVVLAALVLLITVLPALISIYKGEARERFQTVSIFQESVLLDKSNLARIGLEHFNLDGEKQTVNTQIELLFHNKPAIFAQVFSLNYLRAFSFEFLFGKGDPNYRHSIQEMGELYLFELPLLLLGLYALISKVKPVNKLIILAWLLIAPIPASLTYDGGFHGTRLILMLPPLMVLNALGLDYMLDRIKKMPSLIAVSLIAIFAVVGVGFYMHRYYVHYPIESWRWWQIGYKEALTLVQSESDKYDTVVINNSYEPSLERYLFFTKYDPAIFQRNYRGDKAIENILPGVDGFKLGEKIYFGQINKPMKDNGGFDRLMRPGMLYLVSARDESESDLRGAVVNNYTLQKTFYTPQGAPIFYLLSGK